MNNNVRLDSERPIAAFCCHALGMLVINVDDELFNDDGTIPPKVKVQVDPPLSPGIAGCIHKEMLGDKRFREF